MKHGMVSGLRHGIPVKVPWMNRSRRRSWVLRSIERCAEAQSVASTRCETYSLSTQNYYKSFILPNKGERMSFYGMSESESFFGR